MNVNELKGKIDKKVNELELENIKKLNDAQRRKNELTNKIKSYAPDLKELFEVANYCLDKGIPLDCNIGHNTSLTDKQKAEYFFTDGWFHYLGFYATVNPHPTKIKIDGIGYVAGGACGDTNFKVLEDGTISRVSNCGYVDRYAESFVEEIDAFISRFERYIKSL